MAGFVMIVEKGLAILAFFFFTGLETFAPQIRFVGSPD
jgi:hypothetical protein